MSTTRINPNSNLVYNTNNNNNDKTKQLTSSQLENLKNFKYSCTNSSILYNTITSPLIEKYLMKHIPLTLAPNTITLLSFIFNFLTFILISFEAGNDFTRPLSRLTCLIQSVSHLIYIILDNSDGKQARRTNSASPMGLLFDHGFDVLTTCIVVFNTSHMAMTGNTGIRSGIIMISLFIGFWANVYEEWIVGEMHLGVINGADEGNMIIVIGSFLSGIFGPYFWKRELIKFDVITITIGDLMLVFLCLGCVQCVIQAVVNIFKHSYRHSQSPYQNQYSPYIRIFQFLTYKSTNMWLILLLLITSTFYNPDFHARSLYLIFILLSLTFSRIVIEMQVNIVTAERNPVLVNRLVLYTHILLFLILSIARGGKYTLVKQFFIILLVSVNLVSFLNYTIAVLREMKESLGIQIFSIRRGEKED